MTRVLIADDHQLLRQAVRRSLEDAGFQICAEAGDGEEAVRLALTHKPDVVVTDVTMPVLDGIEVARRVHLQEPGIPILVLTMHAEAALRARAIEVGATAFLTKDAAMHEVVAMVRALADGDVLSAELAGGILAELATESPAPRTMAVAASAPPSGGLATAPGPEITESPVDSPLTPREEEILQLIADGSSTTDVAKELFISAKTVKNHLASIYAKLDARDRTQAVLAAVRGGIIRLR